jgi:hypothetical protein
VPVRGRVGTEEALAVKCPNRLVMKHLFDGACGAIDGRATLMSASVRAVACKVGQSAIIMSVKSTARNVVVSVMPAAREYQ